MPLTDLVTLAGTVLSLVVLEGLLSADNALVLAVMVRHLPKHQRKKALRYGVIGAFGFRLIAVLMSTSLMSYWIFKVVGGLYLLYLALKNLLFGDPSHKGDEESVRAAGFWRTVIAVEFADIAFSIDSILAAVAVAQGLPKRLIAQSVAGLTIDIWVVFIGGILGIITMRYVAGYFIILIERFSGLAVGAYALVAWIGLKLVGGGFHVALHDPSVLSNVSREGWRSMLPEWLMRAPLEMNETIFWAGMALILALSFLYRPKLSHPQDAAGEITRVQEVLAGDLDSDNEPSDQLAAPNSMDARSDTTSTSSEPRK